MISLVNSYTGIFQTVDDGLRPGFFKDYFIKVAAFEILQPFCHLIKGIRELPEFVFCFDMDPVRVVFLANFLDCSRQFVDWGCNDRGEIIGKGKSDNKYHYENRNKK